METCYKAIRTELFKSISIESNDFCFEPEITIKLAGRGVNILEVPISYNRRSFREGKKINYKDVIKALFAMVKYGWPGKDKQELRILSLRGTQQRSNPRVFLYTDGIASLARNDWFSRTLCVSPDPIR
jgi:hypothetical protein